MNSGLMSKEVQISELTVLRDKLWKCRSEATRLEAKINIFSDDHSTVNVAWNEYTEKMKECDFFAKEVKRIYRNIRPNH